MKAVLQYPASPRFRAMLEDIASPELRIDIVPVEDKARFAATMQDADVLLHVLEPVTAEVIAKAPELKLIQKIGVGVNTIDLEAARAHGVAVANIPGSNAQAVAELTILLMLASLRRLVTLDEATRRGESWPPAPELVDRFGELGGRTVGLVGYGEIASRVAGIAQAFGARVIYTARSRKSAAQAEWRDLNALLAEADIVSLHLPETDGTRGLMDAEAFQRMPQGAVLINTARGGLVDEAAPDQAHQAGSVPGQPTALRGRDGGVLRRPPDRADCRGLRPRGTTDAAGVCPALRQSAEERRPRR